MNPKIVMVLRILLGVLMLVFGLNKFLGFIPLPELPEAARNFMGALGNTGYLMQLVALIEIVGGILLLVNKYVPLALVLLFPVMLNAFLFHAFLDLPGIGGSLLGIGLNIALFFAYKDRFDGILRA